ncbi:Uncharacterised protein [Yersinia intermedia]|uniref:Uncharacterized protein n=1 Tax=Yersinia intermedia TaxID=631 RepID=A0A0T9N433_YERIN|nr:hypothetical protein CH53_3000 [Yersinia intermedia]CNE37223.1 Uncharacterised protein [Yersinia intermedia]CNG75956.1 Uncharacterised protein [Yersinia intermedia]CNH93982.1 Uncharacterised protein [Yersinia intermedia]CNI72238.1 Uncharacterised protein [Yersinia intermedia]
MMNNSLSSHAKLIIAGKYKMQGRSRLFFFIQI